MSTSSVPCAGGKGVGIVSRHGDRPTAASHALRRRLSTPASQESSPLSGGGPARQCGDPDAERGLPPADRVGPLRRPRQRAPEMPQLDEGERRVDVRAGGREEDVDGLLLEAVQQGPAVDMARRCCRMCCAAGLWHICASATWAGAEEMDALLAPLLSVASPIFGVARSCRTPTPLDPRHGPAPAGSRSTWSAPLRPGRHPAPVGPQHASDVLGGEGAARRPVAVGDSATTGQPAPSTPPTRPPARCTPTSPRSSTRCVNAPTRRMSSVVGWRRVQATSRNTWRIPHVRRADHPCLRAPIG